MSSSSVIGACLSHARVSASVLAMVVAVVVVSVRPAGAAEKPHPGKLIWEANFDDGALPAGWTATRYPKLLAFVADPEAKGGRNLVLTNSGDNKSNAVEIEIPVEQNHFRLEWRAYVPGEPPYPIPNIGISNEYWTAGIDGGRMGIAFRTMRDTVTGQDDRRRQGATAWVPFEPGWQNYAVEKIGRSLYVEINGIRAASDLVPPANALKSPLRLKLAMPRGGSMIDDVRLYDMSDKLSVEPGGVRLAFYPSLRKLFTVVYANTPDVREAKVSVIDPNGKTVVEQTVPVQNGSMIGDGQREKDTPVLDLPELVEGRYQVVATLPDGKGAMRQTPAQIFEWKKFPWVGNKLGITDEVLPPFTPIEVKDQNVDVVLRKYKLTGLGLIEQVEAKGQDADEDYEPLLASPVVLVANGQALQGSGKFTATAPNKVTYEGQAEHPAVTVKLNNLIEEDGCMRMELTLAPGSTGAPLESLALEIPIKDEMAPLWHLGTASLRGNPAGSTPAGSDVVWDSREKKNKYHGNFQPYFWFGAEARGLCWFADNDKGWEVNINEKDPQQSPPCQEIIRKDGVLTLRVNLVQKRLVLTPGSERTIVFGLMATPAKPMPKDWRTIGRKDGQRISFSMGNLFGLPSTFGGKYPMGGDFAPLDFIRDSRLGKIEGNAKDAKATMIEAWIQKNLNGPMFGDEARDLFRQKLTVGLARYNKSSKTQVTAYFDELHGTSYFHEETPVYRTEWEGDGSWAPASPSTLHGLFFGKAGTERWFHPEWAWVWRIKSDKLPPSYQDFACWYGAEWIKRGVGLYFDNAFPRYINDPLFSDAYYLPNGRIQPSAGIWEHRQYLRRIWTLHQQLKSPDMPQVMMVHMTNTHIVPYLVWNEANLDLEWQMRLEKKFQVKWSPELLRAEVTGLHSGTYPVGMGDIAGNIVSKEWLAENKESYKRARIMGFLVHEIKPGISTALYPKQVDEFGYGLEDCKVVNYWDKNVPLSVSDDQCKWLLLERNGQTMVVLCTWNPNDSEVTLRLKGKALTQAVDAEADKPLPLNNGALTIPMTGFGSRIILLK